MNKLTVYVNPEDTNAVNAHRAVIVAGTDRGKYIDPSACDAAVVERMIVKGELDVYVSAKGSIVYGRPYLVKSSAKKADAARKSAHLNDTGKAWTELDRAAQK